MKLYLALTALIPLKNSLGAIWVSAMSEWGMMIYCVVVRQMPCYFGIIVIAVDTLCRNSFLLCYLFLFPASVSSQTKTKTKKTPQKT